MTLFTTQGSFSTFVRRLEEYDVIPEEERKLYRRTGGSGGQALMDAAKRREAKIAQFKKEKELRGKIMVHPTSGITFPSDGSRILLQGTPHAKRSD